MRFAKKNNYVPNSHHIGAALWTLFDQMMALTAHLMHKMQVHRADASTPAFHDRYPLDKRGIRTRIQAMKFAIGTRGYVGSMLEVKRKHPGPAQSQPQP